ncbi:MAG: phage antirepressor KilAC domain-containing protein [Bacteroidaceae bacterium]
MSYKIKQYIYANGNKLSATTYEDKMMFSLKDLIKLLSIEETLKTIKQGINQNGAISIDVSTSKGSKKETFIDEANLNKFYAKSNVDDVDDIIDWLTNQVIPKLREYCGYSVNALLEDPDKVVTVLKKLEKLTTENSLLRNKMETTSIHSEIYQNTYGRNESVPLIFLARYLCIDGINQVKLMEILRGQEVLQPNDLPYQKYIDNNYFSLDEHHSYRNGELEVRFTPIVYKTGMNYVRKILVKLAGDKND